MDAVQLHSRLRDLLEKHEALATLSIEVHQGLATKSQHTVLLILRDLAGHERLRRDYTLGRADCQQAPTLLALAVERALVEFPSWEMPKSLPERDWRLGAGAGLLAAGAPFGTELALSSRLDYGDATHRLGVSALARSSWPHVVGGGRSLATSALGGLTWRMRRGRWSYGVELRGGLLLLSGLGFVSNQSRALFWSEGALVAQRHLGNLGLGLSLAASPNRYRAVTVDGENSRRYPWLRFGLEISWAP
jgi:hypothetical protein